MDYKKAKQSVKDFTKKMCLVEMLVIILLSSYIWNVSYFHCFYFTIPNFFSHILDRNKSEKFVKRGRDKLASFLEDNLDVYGYDDLDKTISGKRKIFWPNGMVNGPVFLSPEEKKPYYLFNVDVHYKINSLRLFRKFTLGDSTPEFANTHKEVKAVVFYQKDLDKLKNIKRKIKDVILQDKGSNPLGLMLFDD